MRVVGRVGALLSAEIGCRERRVVRQHIELSRGIRETRLAVSVPTRGLQHARALTDDEDLRLGGGDACRQAAKQLLPVAVGA